MDYDMTEEELGKVVLVPRLLIRPFPDQPRKFFDQRKLEDLTASIRAVGQKVPGIVKEIEGDRSPQKYELIDGQRRWHALGMAGVRKMKVIVSVDVKTADEQFLASVVANFGREDHTPVEIALAIQRLKNQGMTWQQVAEVFAHSLSWVTQHHKILQLHPNVLRMMSSEIPEEDRLVFSVALTLADVPQDLQGEIANFIVTKGLKMNLARSYIRNKAMGLGIKVGSPDRSPRKDYAVLRSFVGRLRRELGLYDEVPQEFFDKIFQYRKEKDCEKVATILEENIKKLGSLLRAMRKAPKIKEG